MSETTHQEAAPCAHCQEIQAQLTALLRRPSSQTMEDAAGHFSAAVCVWWVRHELARSPDGDPAPLFLLLKAALQNNGVFLAGVMAMRMVDESDEIPTPQGKPS